MYLFDEKIELIICRRHHLVDAYNFRFNDRSFIFKRIKKCLENLHSVTSHKNS